MIKFGILTCDNCRKILSTGVKMLTTSRGTLEQSDNICTLKSGYDSSGRSIGEGVHVCSDRCERGEFYNKSKEAKTLMHDHFYGSKKNS